MAAHSSVVTDSSSPRSPPWRSTSVIHPGVRSSARATISGSRLIGRGLGASRREHPRHCRVGEELVVASAGHLVDGSALPTVIRAHPHLVETAAVEGLVGAVEG